jgi:hypothetical protein
MVFESDSPDAWEKGYSGSTAMTTLVRSLLPTFCTVSVSSTTSPGLAGLGLWLITLMYTPLAVLAPLDSAADAEVADSIKNNIKIRIFFIYITLSL